MHIKYTYIRLGGGFRHFLMSTSIPGEMIQFEKLFFSNGLKPPNIYIYVYDIIRYCASL